uniref:transketolase n=1 Tax=Glossina pallidipes TaxID=7398 RepID=A0A1A9ZYT1_GLOPL
MYRGRRPFTERRQIGAYRLQSQNCHRAQMLLGRVGIEFAEILVEVAAAGRYLFQRLAALAQQLHQCRQLRAGAGINSLLLDMQDQMRSDVVGRQMINVMVIQPQQLFGVESAGGLAHRLKAKELFHLVNAENLLIAVGPSQSHQIVQQRFRQKTVIAVLHDPYRAVAFGEFFAIIAQDHRDVAIENARAVTDKPSLLMCKTVIAFGAPTKAGTHGAHGAPLGDDEIAATRKALGWNEPPFVIPAEIYQGWDAKEAGKKKEAAWNDKFAAYEKAFPELAREFKRRMNGELPTNWQAESQKIIEQLQAKPAKIATRKASQNALEAFGPMLPEFLGGSADLAPSNLTIWSKSTSIANDPAGNYIHYGVREFGMTAIGNGIAHHGGFVPYTATFLMFVEYARNAVRMAALMKARHIMVYTHDSIGLGEDGPTHQPVEQLASLRMTPNMSNWRPCDQVETAVAWKRAIERHDGPTALILSRQNLAQQDRTAQQVADIARGGYVLKDCEGQPELILIATGSEVELAVAAYEQLQTEGRKVRVVSLPSSDFFDAQDDNYRESVLPKAVTARVAIEAGIADYWYKYVGLDGQIVGMTTFGESAPAEELFKVFGFTKENVLNKARSLLK